MLQEIQNRGFDENALEHVHIPPLGPPGPTENDCLMHRVVMFGLEMLGLVNFDKRKRYVLFIKKDKTTFPTHGSARAHRRCLSVGGCSHIWLRNVRFS